jgi:hypothetical protein
MRALTFEASVRKRHKEVYELANDIITTRFRWETFDLARRIDLCNNGEQPWDWLEMELDLVQSVAVKFKQSCDEHPSALPHEIEGMTHSILFVDLVNITMFDEPGAEGHDGNHNRWNDIGNERIIEECVQKNTIIGKKIKAIQTMLLHLRAHANACVERDRLETRKAQIASTEASLVGLQEHLSSITWKPLRIRAKTLTDLTEDEELKYFTAMTKIEVNETTLLYKLRKHYAGECSKKELRDVVYNHCRILQFWRSQNLPSVLWTAESRNMYMHLLRDMTQDLEGVNEEARTKDISTIFAQFSKMLEYARVERHAHECAREIKRLTDRLSNHHVDIQDAEDALANRYKWDAADDLF